MNACKLSADDMAWRPLNRNDFEASTRKKNPYYQSNRKGEDVQYAICPDCNNPIQIIGLYRKLKHSPKPYAKHYPHDVAGLADYDQEAFDCCSLAHPQGNLSRESRRQPNDARENRILTILCDYFDQIAYLFMKQTGISMSRALARSMLDTYLGGEGYRYTGASPVNVPWIFWYMSHGQNLYGKIIPDEDLRAAIREACPSVHFTADNQLQSKSFVEPRFWITKHRQSRDENNSLKESMELVISEGKREIFRKKIDFDYEWFANLMNQPDEKRPNRRFCEIAREMVRGRIGNCR